MIVHQAYRFALDPTPTPAQARASSARLGAAWFAVDLGLTPVLRWSLPAVRNWSDPARDARCGFQGSSRNAVRAIADTGFGEIRRQPAYKTRWRGSCLVVADRWYPSSKTCSDCGVVKAERPLHVRVFRRGPRVGRDLNAAHDLTSLVTRRTTGTGEAGDLESQGSNGRGADRKTHVAWAGGP
ncbi:zinc ribbon domain-containing protein [Lentzea waywayandensis]|uniref:zinc ribbon domain-containing protein n=1 Tax=Lentzea waywayandensis TaxID=84724 RepID=UPI000B85D292|nr:zinc ribbon domain-containing protein [Lentzea waywayandensis]